MPTRNIAVRYIVTERGGPTAGQVRAMLVDVSHIFAPMNIGFVLGQYEEAFDQGLEVDHVTGPPPMSIELKRQARASHYPAELVVFNRNKSGGYSSEGADYVIMGGIDAKLFAHETGHFLHLRHTHNDRTDELHKANQTSYESAVALATEMVRKAGGLHVFENDTPGVGDTPPDPGPPLFQPTRNNPDGSNPNPNEYCTVQLTLDVDGKLYPLVPDRTNLMSYFHQCPAVPTLSADQQSVVRKALTIANRRHLLDGTCPEPPAVLKNARNRRYIFARGDDFDVWQASHRSSGWKAWDRLPGGGVLASGPAAVLMPDNAVHVFAAGTDNHVWSNFLVNDSWVGWAVDAGDGQVTSAPTALVTDDGALHLFARRPGGNIWHNFWKGNWQGWTDELGAGQLTSAADTILTPEGHIHVFARGTDLDIWRSVWDGQRWSGWRNDCARGLLTSGPGAVRSDDGAFHLFARGADRQCWHNFGNGSEWSGWFQDGPGGTFMSGFAPAIDAGGNLSLHAIGDDRQIKVTTFRSAWSAWETVGAGGTFQL
jgi:hypothetical protein